MELADDEFACLIMRACGVIQLQAALGADHGPCRFCSGVLRVA